MGLEDFDNWHNHLHQEKIPLRVLDQHVSPRN